MTVNATRGNLSPAKIINLATNDEVHFMFNPFEYSLTKQNSWEKKPVMGQNIPRVTFQQGGAQTLSLTLHFDTLAEGTDVTTYTDPLWNMMMVDENNENQRSGKGAPPAVAFEWGRLYFKAIITSMTQKFTLFKPDGTPVRCTVDISLEQYLDDTDYPAQVQGQSSSQSASQTTTVREGDRMDHVAASSNGGDASSYRDVAENNNIDNPQNVPTGTTLRTR